MERKNEWGDPVEPQWEPVAKSWARVRALSGTQYFAAQQTVDQSDHAFDIHWRRDIAQGMVIRYDGREFAIQASLDLEGRREWLQLISKEVRPA